MDPEVADAFNVANLWRVETIIRLGLTGESRLAAASPSPMFPQFLDFVVRNLQAAPAGVVVDLGAGIGGISEMVHRTCCRDVLALDASLEACRGTRRLFPELASAQASPSALPVRDHSVSACVAFGLMSLLAEPRQMFEEVCRSIAPGGRVVMVDLASASDSDVRIGSSRFAPAEDILEMLGACGFEVVDQAAGQTSLSEWTLADREVAGEIARTRRGESDFDTWVDDRRRLERVMDSDRVLMIGVAAVAAA